MPKIKTLYAFVIEDKGPDDEGVPAFESRLGPMPMMGADLARVESLRGIAQGLANKARKPIKLIKSTAIEVVEVLEPQQ